MSYGKLFIVATPIGNLDDMTFRAINTLKEANFIICEDTRVTKKLLNHFEITNEVYSFNARTEEKNLSGYLQNSFRR